MNEVWGSTMVAVGLFMLVCGTMKSKFVVYTLLVARSRIVCGEGDAAHRFYQVVGFILLVLGGLWLAGVIWK